MQLLSVPAILFTPLLGLLLGLPTEQVWLLVAWYLVWLILASAVNGSTTERDSDGDSR